MKFLIASDLHGSAYYCRALLEVFQKEQADRLILLGDLLYNGPFNPFPEEYSAKEVASMLNSISDKLFCVRGNCDADVDQAILEFPILADHALICADGMDIFATHGHIYGPENPPPLRDGSFLLCGHTHLPVQRDCGGYTYLNPGSLSLPKEGTPHSYLILEDGRFTWYDITTGTPFAPMQ